ncbi:HdeD family acid-resistance protein [Chishuiella sp.]|uniref:HdeD family acid-resistance protein n=1 Tax=Chishuiella sp. TaxID=1969467 RepID=UPI0028A6E305|nr:HdeD family acid-resistance protein [Chishuiella sp.]
MARTFYKSIKNSIKYWWISLIIGLLFIGLGIYCFAFPDTSYIILSTFFAISFLFSGVSEIIFSISNKDEIDSWGWTLAYGILTTVVGFMLVVNPILSLQVFAFYVGFLFLFRSISGISYAFDLKNYGVKDWGISLFLAILGLIFSFILLSSPQLAGLTAVAWVGLAIISSGFFAIFIAFQLKKLKDLPKHASEDLKNRYNEIRKEIEEFTQKD